MASELAISSAALESPSAEMTAAFFCCSACEGTDEKKSEQNRKQKDDATVKFKVQISPSPAYCSFLQKTKTGGCILKLRIYMHIFLSIVEERFKSLEIILS